jgi:siderophore synthetase component
MVNTMATRKSDIPPIDTAELAEWLAPRPEESYEQWSKRFDKAERTIARREAKQTAVRARPRTRGTRTSRRAA